MNRFAFGRTNGVANPVPLPAAPEQESEQVTYHRYPTWLALRWLFLFRLVLLIGLILLFSPHALDPLISPAHVELAWKILILYALLVLVSGIGLSLHWPGRASQVHLAVYTDILALSLLTYAAGGASSGIGILIVFAVAAGALLMEGRLALLFASFASLAVLTEQIYSNLYDNAATGSYTQAGLLGSIFFAVAILAHILYRRVRTAEAKAARRTVDIASLTKLNAFIIKNLETGIIVVDGERHVRLINKTTLRLLALKGTRPGDSLADIAPSLGQWLDTQVTNPASEGSVVHVGGRELHASLKLLGDYRASGAILYLRDNQELTQEAQQIKLAALGTLTASIAHNIRNPLSAITHASQLFADGKDLPDDDRHLIDIILRNSARIDETVRSVLQLSRRNQMDAVPLDLAVWLSEFVEEFGETHGMPPERWRLEIGLRPATVEVDPRHLHQILSNLCENALIHGEYENEPATISIHLAPGRLVPGEGLERQTCLIQISDAGTGIAPEIAREIFNPFFTTKPSGTGLGLYIARELAETNRIRLTHENARPHGSRFNLLFPS